MAEIRLNKLTKQFNIGLQTLVDFLNGKGANLNLDPNVKVSDEYLPELEKAFGKDLKAKEDSEKVRIKIKEIIEKDTKKKEFSPMPQACAKGILAYSAQSSVPTTATRIEATYTAFQMVPKSGPCIKPVT